MKLFKIKMINFLKLAIPLWLYMVNLTACLNKNSDWNNKVKDFESINTLILNHKNELEWFIDIDSLVDKVPESELIVDRLVANYDLTEIQIYKIDGKENQIGIAYTLGKKSDKPFQYLLFTLDEEYKRRFESYEQFVECGQRKDINTNWSVVSISDCTD